MCIVLGVALLLGALALYLVNRREDTAAKRAAEDVMTQLVQRIQENTPEDAETIPELELQIPVELLTEEDKKMTEVEIDGNYYIGFLTIPRLELELPVMSTWSYPKMKIAPCRYAGSIRGEDLVVMAHNYENHFGNIPQLELGDSVSFTDMDGNITRYQVVGKDVLAPTAVEEMTSGVYDLTLFSCTYGGGSRVTVYCDRVQ